MNISETMKFKLWGGFPIEVSRTGEVYPMKLRDIIELGYENYQKTIGILLIDPDKVENVREGVQTIEVLQDMCRNNEDLKKYILTALELVFKKKYQFIDINGIVFCEAGNLKNTLTLENYEEFKHVLKAQYCIFEGEEEEYNPANAEARKMIERIKKNKANAPKLKATVSLLSMISAITWKGAKGDVHKVLDLTVYQIHDAYYRLMTIDNFDNTMLGIYTGNVEAKKVDMKKLDWAKIIEVVK